ncbi:MAG TPA: TonB-dependent receptor, partial [Pyrinomonadaceae bacterium]|nr:TonB-dependent receptor [Pyrinomonadaceae bacterium]
MRSFQLPAHAFVRGAVQVFNPARRINLFTVLLSTFVLCGTISVAFSQIVTSRVSGTVKDSAGATVPGAKLTLIDTATKDHKTTVTNEEGNFVIADVRPGVYLVTVEATNFKKLQVSGVQVHVDTPVVLNSLTLEAGGVAETVSVTASDAQSLIRSEDAKLTTTIDVKQVQDLPLNGRNPINLAGGMAGVNTNANTRTSVINGMRGSFSNITWDGIEINDNFVRTDALFGVNTPSVASVAEFSVTTQNAGPDDGLGIAQIKLTTPRGGSSYHGEVYDYYRNDKFDANAFFNNATGIAKPKLLQHQYGFNVGGPFALPRFGEGGPLLTQKNKLFFYFFYEYIDTKQDFTPNRTVLLPAARNGIFTYVRTDNGQLNTVNLLALTGRSVDPRIQELLNLTPAANNTSRGDNRNTAGFRFNTPNGSTGRNIGFRIDYEISQKHRIEGVYSHFLSKTPNDVQLNDIGEQFPGLPGGGQESARPRYSLAWISSLTTSITNELRFGFSSSTPVFLNRETFDVGYRLGFPNVGGSANLTNPIQNFLQQGRAPRNHDLINHTTWVKGNHVFKFGTTARFIKILNFNDAGTVPQYNLAFNTTTNINPLQNNTTTFPGGLSSAQFTTASNLLAVVTGAINTGVQTFNVADKTSGFTRGLGSVRHLDYNTLSFYGGDTWRIKENLSLNLGMRWEYIAPLTERDGLGLLPQNTSLSALMDPQAVLDFAGKGTGREFLAKDLNNWAPNFSFAWDPFKTGKTSIRGGFSIAYAIDNNATVLNNSSVGGNAGLQSTVTTDMPGTVSGGGRLPLVAPVFKVPRTIEDNLAISQTPTLFTTEFNLKTPYAEQWNFGIEREIFKDTALSVGYVGNRGVQLTRGLDTNQVRIFENGFLADFLRAQSNCALQGATLAGSGTPLEKCTDARFNPGIPGSQVLTIFPRLGNPTASLRGGNLQNATILNLIKQGQVGELVSNYLSSRCTYFVQNPVQGCSTNFRVGANAALPGQTLLGTEFFLPNNKNAFVTDYIGSSGWSNYHGLQAEIRKRFTNGWYYQVNYTWSKAFTNAEQAQAEFSPYLDNTIGDVQEKKRLNQDIHHVLKANGVYELPFGPGKRFFDRSGLAGKFLGGWQVSGIGQFRTGRPITFTSGRGTLNRSARSGNNTPNTTLSISELQSMVGLFFDPKTGLPLVVDPSLIDSQGRANPAFFTHPTAGTIGKLSLTPVDGPGYWNIDAALIKRVRFKERLGMELRLEAFNVFNHTNFSVPNSLDINDTDFGKINSTFD